MKKSILPQINKIIEEGNYAQALSLCKEVEEYYNEIPSLNTLLNNKIKFLKSKLNVLSTNEVQSEVELASNNSNANKIIIFSGILNIYKVKFLNDLNKSFKALGYHLIWLSEKDHVPSPMTPKKSDIEFEFIEIPKSINMLLEEQQPPEEQFIHLDDDLVSLQANHENRDKTEIVSELNNYYYFIKQLVNKYNIELIILWHQFRAKHLIFQDICEDLNIPYLFTEWGLLPGTIAFDAKGQMAESLISKNSDKFKRLPVNSRDINNALLLIDLLRKQHVRRRREGKDKTDINFIIKKARLKGRTVIFYAGQNDCYSGLFPHDNPRRIEHSPIYKNTFDALINLSDLAFKHNWHIIFKPHPILADTDIPPEVLNSINIEHVSIVNHADFFQCIESSDICTTILSQSAYMFLLYEKPTVLLGKLQLSGKNCCWEVSDGDVEQTFLEAINSGYTKEQYFNFVRHVAQLTHYHLFPLESKVIDSDNTNKELVERNIGQFIHVRNVNDLASLLVGYGNHPDIETGFPFEIHNSLFKLDQRPVIKEKEKSIVFYGINSSSKFSGGRYHAWLMAEACAELGWDVHYLTTEEPSFYKELGDYGTFPFHNKIDLITLPIDKPNCKIPEIQCDVFVFIPHASCAGPFTDNALSFAEKNAKHIALLNFESANWFNSMAPEKRRESFWDGWKLVAEKSSLIFSLAQEGVKHAIPFYTNVRKDVIFDYCYSPINTRIANLVSNKLKEKRIHIFTRLNTKHKGKDFLLELLDHDLAGYTLVLILGSPGGHETYIETLEKRASTFGVKLEIKSKISEIEKWSELKRSSLLIFPSFFEGFGIPPGEALYCNTPCIAFDLPVLREIYGDNLHYVEPGDIHTMKKMIGKLINSGHSNDSKLPLAIHSKLDFEIFSLTADKLFSRLLEDPNYGNENKVASTTVDAPQKQVEVKSASSNRVFYFPFFDDSTELNNHFHRASWYLPQVKGILDEVVFGCPSSMKPGVKPSFMCDPKCPIDHLSFVSKEKYDKELETAAIFLIWRKLTPEENKLFKSLNKMKLLHETERQDYKSR